MRTWVLGAWAFGCSAAMGQAIDPVAIDSQLVVNEVPIHRVATSLGDQSPDKRAQSAAQTVARWAPGQNFSVQVVPGGRRAETVARVNMGTSTVLTVTPAEAKASQSDLKALAQLIANRLNQASRLPAIQVGKPKVELPPDRQAEVSLVGSMARKSTIKAEPQGLVEVQRVPGKLLVRPMGLGSASIQVVAAGHAVQVPVLVMPYALDPTKPVRASVAGRPAAASLVEGAVRSTLLRHAAHVEVRSIDVAPVAPGATRTVRARIRATAPGRFPFEGVIGVEVENHSGSWLQETELWYSNHPENVRQPQRLYWGEVRRGNPVRMLYHHKNVSPATLVVRYMLVNRGDTPKRVAVTLGDAPSDKNPTRAGYRAGEQFLKYWLSSGAEIVELPPQSLVPLTVRTITVGQTMSGLVRLDVLGSEGESVVVLGDALHPISVYPEWKGAMETVGAWRVGPPVSLEGRKITLDGRSQWVYGRPFNEVTMEYTVGGRFGYARIGQRPISAVDGDDKLQGNFGVVYEVQGLFSNPTQDPVTVDVFVEASAGYGAALFEIDGALQGFGMMQSKSETRIARVRLAPGETRTMQFKTVPLSGANYPMTLTARPMGVK
ncbi:MAG: hypothetical protein KF884_04675 [Fimbriimonadaceae bacterium]|nr:hypothetical protein [Fimbriimonadaceae bacterium]QYK59382.1 MAG: hypothetical protein KF884_04675 [Fimbriimonadaceae bacterium]